MARALIVGCGCSGRGLGASLLEHGWQVRGTTRKQSRLDEIARAGIEPALADPDRIATVVDQIEGVSLIYWLLAGAEGDPESVAALHGPRLERLLEEIVDTPVRGFVYEHGAGLPPAAAVRGIEALRAANERWRIPIEVVDADRSEPEVWRQAMVAAARSVIGT